jgi:hypothetical protein
MGNRRKIQFRANANTATGFAQVTVTGTSEGITQTLTFTLAVSAATGTTGSGIPVDLSPRFNLNGICTDGTTYSTGGLDGGGYSYSANLLTSSRVLSGVLFDFGPADQLDAIGCAGQTVLLPRGQYSSLLFLAAGIQGNQASQTFTVRYTDGTTAPFAQSLSDWYTPQTYPGESEAVAMAYRNFDDGTKDNRTFNLYSYRFAIDSGKTVQSVSLPNNPNVVVLAVTLVP